MNPLRPIAFILTSTNHGSLLVNRHDYKLVQNGGYGLGYQILNNSAYDQNEVYTVLDLLKLRKQHHGDGVLAIDCGANVGVHTIEWSKLMYGWGQVISIEAQERIFYALAGNVTINNCFNAKLIWGAVGKSSGIIRIPNLDHFTPSSFGSFEIQQKQGNEFIGQEIDFSENNMTDTRLLTIDELVLPRVDLIKIDIEGMEIDALYGASETIQKNKPILVIEKIKSNETVINEIISGYGYKSFPFGLNILAIHESDPTINSIKIN